MNQYVSNMTVYTVTATTEKGVLITFSVVSAKGLDDIRAKIAQVYPNSVVHNITF